MSRRIGIRTVQSVGGKPPLVCPTGEQLLNPSFEEGSVGHVPDNWTAEVGLPSIDDLWAHTGSYCCHFDQEERIAQDFSNPVHVSCFSILGFWERHFDWLAYVTRTKVYLRYTDGSETVLPINFVSTGKPGVWTDWAYVDLLAYLEAGKTLKGIAIECLLGSDFDWYIDDTTCYC